MLYVSLGSRLRPKIFGHSAMGSAVLCIFNSRLALYFAGSGVNSVQVVLLCFVQAKTFVLGRHVLNGLIPVVVRAMSVLGFVVGVGSEFAVSDECGSDG